MKTAKQKAQLAAEILKNEGAEVEVQESAGFWNVVIRMGTIAQDDLNRCPCGFLISVVSRFELSYCKLEGE